MAWFFLRDVFAGAIFKIQNDLSIGDYIKIGSISGQIKAMKLTFIEVIPDSGQTIKIPNSKLNHELISASTTPEGMEEFNIHLIIDKQYSKQEIEEKIKFIVTTSPWCNYKNPPVIKLQHEEGNSYIYDALVYTLNHQHLSRIEKTLKDKLENPIKHDLVPSFQNMNISLWKRYPDFIFLEFVVDFKAQVAFDIFYPECFHGPKEQLKIEG